MKKYNLNVIALYSLAVIVNIIFIFKYFPLIKLQSENIYNYITEIIEKYPELKEMFGYGFTITTLDLLLGTPFLITCVCIAQSVMLILAIKGFYRLASSVIENRYLLYLAMIIFATHPSLGVYGGTIVTDSFAMAGLIFFISNYRKIMLKPEKKAIFPIVFNKIGRASCRERVWQYV